MDASPARRTVTSVDEELRDEKYSILKQVFEDNGHKDTDLISESSLWFSDLFTSDKQKNFLYLIWANGLDPKTEKRSVKSFLVDLVYALNELDTRIKKLRILKDELHKKSQDLEDTLLKLAEQEDSFNQKSMKFSLLNDTITISYLTSERKSYNLLNYKYKLIFKAGTTNEDSKLIGEEGDLDQCIIKVTQNVDQIYISVLAKIGGQESLLSDKVLPLEEIYTSFPPSYFLSKEIPPTYLIIPYEVDSDISETKEVELRFDLHLGYDMRVKALEKISKKCRNQLLRINEKLTDANKHIEQLLTPFKQFLKYKQGEGFIPTGKYERSCARCNII
jgi:hypothetical protein